MSFNQLAIFTFSILSTFLFLYCPGCFVWKGHKQGLKKVILISITSIALNQYILMLIATLSRHTTLTFNILTLTALWISILFYTRIRTPTKKLSNIKEQPYKKNLAAPLVLTVFTIICSIMPRIDFLIERSPHPNVSIVMSNIHDDIKHIATLKAISLSKLDAPNPFFAKEQLKYYLGYYILPAAFIHTFNLSPTVVWFFWTLITNILWILSLFILIHFITRSQLTAVIIVFSTFIVGGWDILPSLYYDTTHHIESWNNHIGSNVQIPTTYGYLIYLPQHIFATNIFLFLSYTLLKRHPPSNLFSYVLTGLALSIITVNSAYIGIFSIILTCIILFINRTKTLTAIHNIVVVLSSAALTITPLLSSLVGNSPGFKLWYPSVTALSSNPIASTFLALTFKLLIDLGWLLLIGLIALIYFLKNPPPRKFKFLLFQVITFVTTIILVHFISTKFHNDWGMKGSIFLYTSLAFLSAYYIGKSWKRLLIFSPVIAIGIATFGLTIFKFSQPYLLMETSSIQALKYADTNTPASSIIVGDEKFYNSLIPIITNHTTIVSPLSAEANTVANQTLFASENSDLQTIYTTNSNTEFDDTLRSLNASYIFLIRTSSKNYSLFLKNSLTEEIYNKNSYALFRLKHT